ncbi:RNA polymerase II fifth largest subunit, putative isoform 1 [Theobroma cacao]|uniref:RNA polymerase II fifth largest subunit, putative isoform 1 n=1 Tax=Theobroma cacao TaxID=3641 RepID=A0A061FSM7_THECC|nr:RNA polymerase II fifth largest subunit, putative isoform 1 [Theobroma cacao]
MATNFANSGEVSGHVCNDGGAEGAQPCIKSMVDQGSVESHRFYLARKTVWEMLKDRGYNVADSELTPSITEFRSVFGDQPDLELLRISVSLRSNPSKKSKGRNAESGVIETGRNDKQRNVLSGPIEILVVFMGTNDIRKATVCALKGQILNESLSGLILILQSKMNSFALKELKNFPFKVELFKIADLYVNITKHFLMPKHEVLTAEEKQKLLKKYQLEDKQLPQMLQTDPIARYYGLEKGQVVKVTYSEEFVQFHEQYRCVV